MSVQTVSPERAVEVLTIELESKQDKIAELKAKIDEQAATIATLEKEIKWRKRDSEHLMELGAQYKELTATNDRQSLMIYAKDRQIAELTRMLFALGKQDGQTIRELKGIAANLAKHLEAINNICEREDVDYQAWKKIRAHCEAANVMEAV